MALTCGILIFGFGSLSLPESDIYTVDSDAPEVVVSFVPGERIDLKCKAEENQKIWILIEFPLSLPGVQFARPTDEYCRQNGGYLFLFSENGRFAQNAQDLYYTPPGSLSKIDLGRNDFSGLKKMVVTIRKGELSQGLADIQKITLEETSVQIAQSEKTRNLAPAVEPSELTELVNGNNSFAFDLYQALRGNNDNLFYSPYSIYPALAMTYAGARNETRIRMASTLHYTLSPERLHPAFNALDLELARRGECAAGQDGKGFRLNIANGLWGQTGYPFLPEFLDTLAVNYGAGLKLLDFESAPENSRLVINDWVSGRTEGKIKDLIPSGVITSLTRLVLTNAIYFNAAWKYPFDEQLTQTGSFHLLDGGETTAPMMSQTKFFSYTSGEGYQAVELPYDGDELSMLIVLPDAGRFKAFEDSLDARRINALLEDLESKNITLTMPKFTYTSGSVRLKETLSAMGMGIAFTEDADFSGIDGTTNLRISDVIHKAFVSVNEAGTEAAAATAVVVEPTAAPEDPVKVTLDRPFIFMIRDIKTGAVLFVGRILNPSA